jgi:hypothetical protein
MGKSLVSKGRAPIMAFAAPSCKETIRGRVHSRSARGLNEPEA